MTDWSRVRAETAATRVTPAQARATHAHAWPSLPAAAAGASRHEIAHAPAAIEALIAGILHPTCPRRQAGGAAEQRARGRPSPSSGAGRSTLHPRVEDHAAVRWPSAMRKQELEQPQQLQARVLPAPGGRARTTSAGPDATRPGERTRRRLRPRGRGTTTPRQQHRLTQAQSRQARSAEFRRSAAPAGEAVRVDPTGGSRRTSHPTPRLGPGFEPDRRSR